MKILWANMLARKGYLIGTDEGVFQVNTRWGDRKKWPHPGIVGVPVPAPMVPDLMRKLATVGFNEQCNCIGKR